MPENISPETVERIRALCRQLAAEHRLDLTQQRVLQSRIEAHLCEYVFGERKLTEDEAFTLMSRHFGEPKRVAGLLQEVHASESRNIFAERIGTLFIATPAAALTAEAFNRMLFPVLDALSGWWTAWSGIANALMAAGSILLPALFLWLVLRYSVYRESRPEKWYPGMDPYNTVNVIAFLVGMGIFLRLKLPGGYIGFEGLDLVPYGYEAAMALQCAVWFWWCGRSPRWIGGMALAPLLWGFCAVAINFYALTFVAGRAPFREMDRMFVRRNFTPEIVAIITAVGIYLLTGGLRTIWDKKAVNAVH
ncbi:MAG: hypothetical protein ACYC9O_12310 [Candidatus Latescibacterota bacterium]